MVSMGGLWGMDSMGYGYIREEGISMVLGGFGERGCFWGKSCYGHMLTVDIKAYMLYYTMSVCQTNTQKK